MDKERVQWMLRLCSGFQGLGLAERFKASGM